jgi:3-oxoacyl-[acyl-carrier protein] reductase
MKMAVKDNVVIVTGGAKGIGAVISKKFAESGAKVVIVQRDEVTGNKVAAEIKEKGGEALFIKTDVSIERDALAMAKITVEKYGRIDVLVNNAAYKGPEGGMNKPFDQIPVEEWDRVMAVNLRGTWLCCKAVSPYMKAQKKGKIINTSSSAWDVGYGPWLHYVTTKAGLIGFTRSLAREFGEYNVNVNCVSYGSRIEDQFIKKQPTFEDLFGTVLFLASEESDFVTGQTIHPNAGAYLH